MKPTLQRLLDVSRQHWPFTMKHLHAKRMEPLARRLPPVSGLILERRMHDPTSACDLSIRAARDDGMMAWFASARSGEGLPRHWMAEPLWQRILDFYGRCVTCASHSAIETTWLEFDEATFEADIPIPCFFFNCRPDASPADSQMLASILTPLTGWQWPEAMHASVRAALSALPKGGGLRNVGTMLSRDEASSFVRLCLQMPCRTVAGYLDALGLKMGEEEGFGTGSFCPPGATVTVNLDVGREISAAYSVEVALEEETSWAALESHFSKGAWYHPRVLDEVGLWEGCSMDLERLDGEGVSICYAPTKPFFYLQRPNHIKWAFSEGGEPLESKVYLYLGFGWVGSF